ncbi:3-hydroxyacyl-CoA dehydrogenase NAD-binding domain-containing protein [Microvirga sp. CF3016]|uniref:3-hydroxyacyl-CoA dehydrogenase NAD-binding domain-containing protein n=1 Tax=Microvirga sp. CF3016 TaxID=3110181 RepID=UPI002E76EACF|nr:3-hydroxyacyl-CoA dehydrogenase NAD-binding domain-containing protein [Microvirga sp. CF3016]MEE1612545.1 3-hydroxyacyl-CoA dehydrogenase NAD-binding domain-containing protein [Microvirga sp. CF3016]
MTEPTSFESAGPVRLLQNTPAALIEIDNPPINATSQAVRAGLLAAIREVERNPQIEAVVIACAGRTFVAGADIREFGQPPREPHLPDVINAIEACSKPVVAAIHGTALGGGCEIALACHARMAEPGASFGLPEVKLGLVPGAGGTQRLPRLVGLDAALDLVTSGQTVKAAEALRLGLVDRLSSGDLRQDAMDLAQELIGKPLHRTGERPVTAMDAEAASARIAEIRRKARGAEAPGKAAELVLLSATLSLQDGMARERKTFLELRSSDQSAALRHAFFAEREVTRLPGLESVEPRPVQKVGIVGAGTMGSGIAIAFADAGFDVKVVETSEQALAAGQARIADVYDKQAASGRITAALRDERLQAIGYAVGTSSLSDRDLVIEAVFEDLEVKRALFRDLDVILPLGTILATNTSYLDISLIANATSRPADVVGLHFFSPANVMKLLEIVRTDRTADDVVATGLALAKRLRKIPVVCRVCDGFVGNRILSRYRQQAEYLLEEGALPHEIDAALEAFGFPMGPFAVSDLAGLDIAWARRKRLAPTRDPRERYVDIADRLCEAGRFGRKTGAGWYRYEGGKREVDPSVTALVEGASQRRGLTRRPIAADEIQSRIRAAIVNEACKILDERIVERPLDVDVVMMHGYGYPAWRGGPLFEADRVGLQPILDQVQERAAQDGPGWEPADGLVRRAASGAKFYP